MGEPVQSITTLRILQQYSEERQWHLFPVHGVVDGKCTCGRVCGRPGKHPRTPNGSKDATTDFATLAEWWKKWPDANIGVACGPSGLLVVDVDPRNDGDGTFADLEARHGAFPKTLTVNTGGGGQHYYYDVRGVDGRFKGRVLGQGVELQGSGQYIIAPPSSHYSGKHYEWDFGQEDHPVFPPSWLVDEQNRKARLQEQAGAPMDCILGVAFSAAGMIGPVLGPDRVAVQCPWESEHTQGSTHDSSTIVFGPVGRSRWGWFMCSHAHCKERLAALQGVARMHEVLKALPEKAAKFASERVSGAERELRRVTRSKWEESLVWDRRGEFLVESAGNLRLLFDNMQEWSSALAYDESKDRLFWCKRPPEVVGMRTPSDGDEISEHDWMYVAQWFNLNKRANFKKETAADVMVASGHQNARNSLNAYVDGVRVGSEKHLDSWLVDFCGAEDTPINRRMGRCWLISAVARAMSPGCQADHILVLEGRQGLGKTSVFRVLGGEWYLGNLPRLDDKDARHILSGAWLVEIQELAAIRGAAIEKVKAFITETFDYFRPPYGRNFIKRYRRCVFGASVNDGEFVGDSEARRFWPVKVGVTGPIDLEGLRGSRDQLWAEAREAYLNGEAWHLPAGDALQAELSEAQAARLARDPWESLVVEYLRTREMVTGDELLRAIGVERAKAGPTENRRIGMIAMALGWERRRVTMVENGPRVWAWCRVARRW